MHAFILAALTLAVAQPSPPPNVTTAIDQSGASRAFAQAHALCSADNGKLWHHTLCGPMMFVDPQTREAVASRDGTTIERFSIPESIGVANTSVTYQGLRWTMITWPLTDDPKDRAVTFMHESYHRIQPDLGLTGASDLGTNGHLDTENGRIWLRGELHALDRALAASGRARTTALRDALLMRAYRHSLFPGSAEEERGVEINEGLAESTGITLGLSKTDRIPHARQDVVLTEQAPSLVRAFVYGTGTSYPILLDQVSSNWRAQLTGASDLAEIARTAYHIKAQAPSQAQALATIKRYGGESIVAEERARTERIATVLKKYAVEFLNGPTLSLDMHKFNITFNPRAVEQFAEHGSVYHTLELSDAWGVLRVTGGDALVAKAFDRCTLKAPANASGSTITGDGWTLKLAPGYSVAPSTTQSGSFVVTKQ